MASSNWQQHVELTQLIRRHPDWDDARVMQEYGLKPLEADKVQAARREVEGENVPGEVRSQRSY